MREQYDFSKGKRGPVLEVPSGKTRITIRIDDDLLEWFRQRSEEMDGVGYQVLINRALRAYVEGDVESLEQTFRRVLREELPRAKGA